MKPLVLISLVFYSLNFFAQAGSIKVRKPVSQARMESTVTLCGKYQGTIDPDSLVKDHQLKIWNNTAGLKIVSFNLVFNGLFNGAAKIYHYCCANDTLTREVLTDLAFFRKGGRLSVETIKAVAGRDTVLMNPIILRFD